MNEKECRIRKWIVLNFVFFISTLEYIVLQKYGLTNKSESGAQYENWGLGIVKDLENRFPI